MRSFIFALAFLLAATSRARAEDEPVPFTSLELQLLPANEHLLDVNGTVAQPIRGPVGAYAFFYVDADYAEAIVGPLYAPKPWLMVGAGAGIEQAESGSWRVGGMVWTGNEHVAWTTFVETGAGGPWARSEFVWKLPVEGDGEGLLGIGFLADTLVGAGPRFEINAPYVPVQCWVAALLYHEGEANWAAGLRLNI